MSAQDGHPSTMQRLTSHESDSIEAKARLDAHSNGRGVFLLLPPVPDWSDRAKAIEWLEIQYENGRQDQSKLLQYLLSLI